MVAEANRRGMTPSSVYCFLALTNVWTSAFQVVPKPLSVLRSQHRAFSSTPYISQKECLENKWRHRKPNEESSALYSLNKLVQDVNEATGPRTVFVGGKGGVGKTTVSSALAVALATDMMSDKKILVVSTDPAHSLGDALDVDTSALRAARGRPIQMTDPLTAGRLYACEVDPSAAIDNFRENLAAFDIDRMADALGVSASFLDDLGLREFSGLLNNPPPGLDELVALANVLESNPDAQNFDITVVDTAPTGHTLRMLALPQFLDGFLGKLIKLRAKLSGLTSTLQGLFGNGAAADRAKTIDDAVSKLEEFQVKIMGLRRRLQDATQTSFVVVTIPTKSSVSESKRLMQELDAQGVAVTDVVVNQCASAASDDEGASDVLAKFYERRRAGQQRWIREMQEAVERVSGAEEYQSNGDTGPIVVTEVPFFDVELIGVPALGYLGRESFSDSPAFLYLLKDEVEDSKFIICGGKGGVGKTTTSSALAVAMAGAGHNVALVSTDPAHSLGDAFDMNFSGGQLIDVPLIGLPPSEGSLSVMEVDPSEALGQFKTVVDQLIGSGDSSQGLGSTLKDLGEIFDTLPAGTDEVVALAKVIGLIKKGGYDRIVLDTAPTGHTLRMLSTPAFLSELIDRVLMISDKVNSNAAVKMLISAGSGREKFEEAADAAKSTLLSFQRQMYDLEDLFANPDQTEFLIVTVPTELAVRESVRLLNDLTFEAPDMPIKVRNVVINQVLNDGTDVDAFFTSVEHGQATSMNSLKIITDSMKTNPEITKVPYLDTEPRGIFGLKALAYELMKEE